MEIRAGTRVLKSRRQMSRFGSAGSHEVFLLSRVWEQRYKKQRVWEQDAEPERNTIMRVFIGRDL